MPLDYDRLYQERLAANLRKVRDQLTQDPLPKTLGEKIDRFADKFGVSRAEVVESAIATPLFAATFATDPVKQSLHEKAAADYIPSMKNLVSDFIDLPNRGAGALFVTPDGTLSQTRPAGSGTSAKSIDFTWTSGGFHVYALHKWTRESGGGQDHQLSEVRRFLSSAAASRGVTRDPAASASQTPVQTLSQPALRPTLFVAIVDGAYYASKIEALAESVADHDHVIVCDINSLGRRLHPFACARHRSPEARRLLSAARAPSLQSRP